MIWLEMYICDIRGISRVTFELFHMCTPLDAPHQGMCTPIHIVVMQHPIMTSQMNTHDVTS